jgi:Domain of unknown function (DUF5658)
VRPVHWLIHSEVCLSKVKQVDRQTDQILPEDFTGTAHATREKTAFRWHFLTCDTFGWVYRVSPMATISRVFRTGIVVIPALMCVVPASAQIASTKPYAALFIIRDVGVAVPEVAGAVPLMPALTAAAPVAAIPFDTPQGTPRGLQPALYGSMLLLQGLDVHSTLRAIDAGHHEQNPLMRWTVSHPVAFISMKVAASAATIYVAEKIRKRHPKRALLFMAAVNSAYALIVVHNYNVPIH